MKCKFFLYPNDANSTENQKVEFNDKRIGDRF